MFFIRPTLPPTSCHRCGSATSETDSTYRLPPRNSFTLIEVGVTIAVIAVFLGFTFSTLSFRRDFWSLREQSFSFTKELQRSRELSFQGIALANQRVCAVGLLVSTLPPSSGVSGKKTLGVAVATTTRDCLLLRQASFNLTSSVNPEANSAVVKLTPTFGFATATGPYLSRTFTTTTLIVEADGTTLNFTTFEFVFRNPYGEPIAFANGLPLDDFIAPRRWAKLTFRVQLKDEQATVSVTRTGQLLLR